MSNVASACGAVVRSALRRTRGQWFDLALMAHQAIYPSGRMMEVDSCVPASDGSEGAPLSSASSTQIRGMPKSGRWWKSVQPARHSAIIKVKPLKSSWKKKMADKEKLTRSKLLQQEIRDRQLKEKQEKIERRKEQERRRIENERKGEVVQVIRNTAKVRKAKKKQLRLIEKRDTN
ncbi:coiled-coil domain containing 86 [Parelaphostrongylus tenuis]|uniref:Coiled-coil domain-containing protein 86 n=1 Tax=Parelaphostrongylus tenuis TaxID=148309 RepID=A0AAD5N4R5_PARTN|nr:coiled-coil domain containing 86 [Parelaphostrongylus tenuis]